MPLSERLAELLCMWMRGTPARTLIRLRRHAAEAGILIELRDLETLHLAGCDPDHAVAAMIEAKRRGMDVAWSSVTACELAGRDALAAVHAGVNPGEVVGAHPGRFSKPGSR